MVHTLFENPEIRFQNGEAATMVKDRLKSFMFLLHTPISCIARAFSCS